MFCFCWLLMSSPGLFYFHCCHFLPFCLHHLPVIKLCHVINCLFPGQTHRGGSLGERKGLVTCWKKRRGAKTALQCNARRLGHKGEREREKRKCHPVLYARINACLTWLICESWHLSQSNQFCCIVTPTSYIPFCLFIIPPWGRRLAKGDSDLGLHQLHQRSSWHHLLTHSLSLPQLLLTVAQVLHLAPIQSSQSPLVFIHGWPYLCSRWGSQASRKMQGKEIDHQLWIQCQTSVTYLA